MSPTAADYDLRHPGDPHMVAAGRADAWIRRMDWRPGAEIDDRAGIVAEA